MLATQMAAACVSQPATATSWCSVHPCRRRCLGLYSLAWHMLQPAAAARLPRGVAAGRQGSMQTRHLVTQCSQAGPSTYLRRAVRPSSKMSTLLLHLGSSRGSIAAAAGLLSAACRAPLPSSRTSRMTAAISLLAAFTALQHMSSGSRLATGVHKQCATTTLRDFQLAAGPASEHTPCSQLGSRNQPASNLLHPV